VYLSSCDTPVGQGAAWVPRPGRSSAARRLVNFGPHSIGAAAGAAAGALNRRNHSGESSCALWSAAAGWLSIRALGRERQAFTIARTLGAFMTFEEFHPVGLTRDVDTGRLFRKP